MTRERTKNKSYHVIPHDDTWKGLQEPLQRGNNSDDSGSDTSSPAKRSSRVLSSNTALAATRVERDKLMHEMEECILKEAELASAIELFDYTRKRCCQEHDEIVLKLSQYEALLCQAQEREQRMRDEGVLEDVLKTQAERERWHDTQVMVQSTLPELLSRLEENIELNSIKIRNIQESMDEIRAQRLSVREAIAEKEEEIAFALTTIQQPE